MRNSMQQCSKARELCGVAVGLYSKAVELCVTQCSSAVRLENCALSLYTYVCPVSSVEFCIKYFHHQGVINTILSLIR